VIKPIVFAIVLIPLCTAQSIAAKRIIITTWISVATYVLWLAFVAYGYTQGTLDVNPSRFRLDTLWTGTTTAAFAFTSSSTIALYASLRATIHPGAAAKTSKSRSFKFLNFISATVAVVLILPLVFLSAPRKTRPFHLPTRNPLKPIIGCLNATTLLLAIPSVFITTPAIPIPASIRRHTTFPVSKIVFITLFFFWYP